jgi:hypothetical protein
VALAIYKEKALSNTITIDQLIDLAKSADIEPIDFGMIEIDENLVYSRIAHATVSNISSTTSTNKDIILLAGIINLHVKNYVLSMEKSQLLSTIYRLTNQLEKRKK